MSNTNTAVKPVVEPVAEPVAQTQSPAGNEDKVSYATHQKLLDEKKTIQRELEKFKKQSEIENEKKLEEEGKFKELLEAKEKRLSELEGVNEKLQRHEERAKKKIEEVIKELPDSFKNLILKFDGDLDEKLSYAEELKKELGKKTSSPASERPGGGAAPEITIDMINNEKDIVKKMEMMTILKQTMPQEYAKLN
jgi:hypothetical protein